MDLGFEHIYEFCLDSKGDKVTKALIYRLQKGLHFGALSDLTASEAWILRSSSTFPSAEIRAFHTAAGHQIKGKLSGVLKKMINIKMHSSVKRGVSVFNT